MVSHWTVLDSLRQSITLDERGAETLCPFAVPV